MLLQRRKVCISDVIKTASSPMIYVTRMWGLFPFMIQKRGTYLTLKLSVKYAIYSFVLGATLVSLTLHGMVNDLKAGSTKSIRMKQQTGKYVTIGDISVVVLIVFIGIFGAPFRISSFFSYVDCINQVDSIIVVSDAKRARNVSILRLCMVLGAATIILVSDLLIWWTIGDRSLGKCQYWHLVYGIERRLRLLNRCLRIDGLSTDNFINGVVNKYFTVFKKTDKLVPKVVGVIDAIDRQKAIVDIFFIRNAKKVQDQSVNEYILKLTRAYLKLCEAAECVNKCCGLIVLIILTSCLLHLVVTPYFLVLEISGRKNPLFATLQVVWTVTHLARLIIIVEASYGSTSEARQIKPLVCKLLCYDFGENIKKQLELFATELNHCQIEFTACGLVKIDRALITSIAGAVTTYLVILIQFQKNDK